MGRQEKYFEIQLLEVWLDIPTEREFEAGKSTASANRPRVTGNRSLSAKRIPPFLDGSAFSVNNRKEEEEEEEEKEKEEEEED